MDAPIPQNLHFHRACVRTLYVYATVQNCICTMQGYQVIYKYMLITLQD